MTATYWIKFSNMSLFSIIDYALLSADGITGIAQQEGMYYEKKIFSVPISYCQIFSWFIVLVALSPEIVLADIFISVLFYILFDQWHDVIVCFTLTFGSENYISNLVYDSRVLIKSQNYPSFNILSIFIINLIFSNVFVGLISNEVSNYVNTVNKISLWYYRHGVARIVPFSQPFGLDSVQCLLKIIAELSII